MKRRAFLLGLGAAIATPVLLRATAVLLPARQRVLTDPGWEVFGSNDGGMTWQEAFMDSAYRSFKLQRIPVEIDYFINVEFKSAVTTRQVDIREDRTGFYHEINFNQGFRHDLFNPTRSEHSTRRRMGRRGRRQARSFLQGS